MKKLLLFPLYLIALPGALLATTIVWYTLPNRVGTLWYAWCTVMDVSWEWMNE